MATVTLDLWHTLMFLPPREEEAYYRTQVSLAVEALRAADGGRTGSERSDDELARDFEASLRGAVREAREGRTVTPRSQIEQAAAASGRRVRSEAYLARLEQAVRAQPFRLAPGAAELLAALRASGYRTAIISNTIGETGRSLRPVLRSLGVESAVDRMFFSDELPWTKPSPEIFWAALRELGATPNECVHVGDGWADIEGARRAALRGAIYFTGLQDYGEQYLRLHAVPDPVALPAEHRVRSLSEVGPLLRELLPPSSR